MTSASTPQVLRLPPSNSRFHLVSTAGPAHVVVARSSCTIMILTESLYKYGAWADHPLVASRHMCLHEMTANSALCVVFTLTTVTVSAQYLVAAVPVELNADAFCGHCNNQRTPKTQTSTISKTKKPKEI